MNTERPDLVSSPTAGDDDSVISNSSNHSLDQQQISYLLRYETMVQQQDAAHKATIEHIKPLFDIIIRENDKLGCNNNIVGKRSSMNLDTMMKQNISYKSIKQALKKIENSTSDGYMLAMQTDRQLMMVIKTLMQQEKSSSQDEFLTLAELLQCYKTVIDGMQTLQHVTDSYKQRTRIKDRTLSLVSLFESSATKLLANEGIPPPQDEPPDHSFERESVKDIIDESFTEDNLDSIKWKNFFFLFLVLLFGAACFFVRVPNTAQVIWPYSVPYQNQKRIYHKRGTIDESIREKSTFLDLSTASFSVSSESRKQPLNINNAINSAATYIIEASPSSVAIEKSAIITRKKPNSSADHKAGKNHQRFVQKKKMRRRVFVSTSVGATAGMLLAPSIWKMISILGLPGITLGGITALGGLILIEKKLIKKALDDTGNFNEK
mmetsp:Transcript_38055/g.43453  ORF Transcript_38055/g.43453 Transcript_38055/m.43453 type:complete len:435 (+) Transcript_38055:185-1489(+)